MANRYTLDQPLTAVILRDAAIHYAFVVDAKDARTKATPIPAGAVVIAVMVMASALGTVAAQTVGNPRYDM